MANLNHDLENLRKLNVQRDRAKELRELAMIPLREIKDIRYRSGSKRHRRAIQVGKTERKVGRIDFDDWLCSEDQVEIALLVKVQNNRDINKEHEINITAEASWPLKEKLANTKLEDLFDLSSRRDPDQVPVLTAALTLQGLVSRAETVFSKASMVCYYRIIRELYEANPPDWMVGAARVGSGGRASAFVTSECIRAISAFQKSVKRTNDYLKNLELSLEEYSILRKATCSFEVSHPLYKWADKAMEAFGLDCYLSTNPRRRQIAIAHQEGAIDKTKRIVPNYLRIFPDEEAEHLTVARVGNYFQNLDRYLLSSLGRVEGEIDAAHRKIVEVRGLELTKYGIDSERYYLSTSAHEFAERAVLKALKETKDYLDFHNTENKNLTEKVTELKRSLKGTELKIETEKARIEFLKLIVGELRGQGERISRRILKTLEPSKKFLKGVIYRELSANEHDFDAGELVFAATALGAMTEWRDNDLLRRASEVLVKALPQNGKMTTRHPFHTNQRGYRLLPVEFEMSKSMAQLFEKTEFPISADTVERILSIFDDHFIPMSDSSGKEIAGWNFLGSPTPNNPSVWATAVSVIALDRIVRMLNSRINKGVLIHFESTLAEKRGKKDPRLSTLIYSDSGFCNYPTGLKTEFYTGNKKDSEKKDMSIALYLQLMRAHVMRAALPLQYTNSKGQEKVPKIFSAILYGPPGTGKTTLAEALALSSEKAVVNISPSDLIVQGQELMEGRARDVFEALSMLSQVVIIFDEFEPVLKRRSEDTTKPGAKKASDRDPVSTEMARAVEELRIIAAKDDPKFQFLLGGMLPKFAKLNKSARENSFVYFLGTNYLKQVDEAAKRPGRFEVKIPIYNACPLSRAGSLLYTFIKENKAPDFDKDPEKLSRFLKTVTDTANEPASELASLFSNMEILEYINNEPDSRRPERTKLPALESESSKLDDVEKVERRWLNGFERHLSSCYRKSVRRNAACKPETLEECLKPPKKEKPAKLPARAGRAASNPAARKGKGKK